MRRLFIFAIIAVMLGAGILTLARRGAVAMEQVMTARVENGLAVLGFDWAEVEVDGLVVELSGNAPDVDAQALALETSRSLARFCRVIDRTTANLAPPERREPPRVEFHRDDAGLTLIGRVHDEEMRSTILDAISEVEPDLVVHDLTGIDAARPSRDWGTEIAVALAAIRLVPRAFVRAEPGSLLVEGVAPDIDERDRMEAELIRLAGPNIALTAAIRVPSRVISPFAFIAEKRPSGDMHLVHCAARTEAEGAMIDAMRSEFGLGDGPIRCPSGLGGPHGDWPGAVRAGLKALAALPAGRVEIAHRSVMLDAAPPTGVPAFERALAALSVELPPGFDLSGAVIAGREAERAARERESYWLRVSRLGQRLSIEGRVADDASARALTALAAAHVGQSAVDAELTVTDVAAPAGWQEAAIAAIDTLSAVPGLADLTVRGLTVRARVPGAREARVLHESLAARVPEALPLRTELTVDLPRLVEALPLSPERCIADLNRAARARALLFDPGSTRMDEASRAAIGPLARIFARCPGTRIEVGGHTDNQGREELNDRLSQGRAEAVVDALVAEGVDADRLVAQGYGETEPVAPNDTPEGRALNRRIAFKLVE